MLPVAFQLHFLSNFSYVYLPDNSLFCARERQKAPGTNYFCINDFVWLTHRAFHVKLSTVAHLRGTLRTIVIIERLHYFNTYSFTDVKKTSLNFWPCSPPIWQACTKQLARSVRRRRATFVGLKL